ncbi:hypothetical protein [Streptomyces sp. NBC_01500]|uniref:hypothetical protein n=1 Tax=Streptomyces sp. NBC_01500 TaxID=2903886 RepID=UPI002253DB8C|nr:hypothetical protein [Streptomyces sp. NBC_01500]MCX4554106.1 hypothetical protein [Streptomyces sp. NBC_01500]
MTAEDPFDPFGTTSPWESHETASNSQEPPVTTPIASSPNPFKIGMTLKAAAGYDAEWFTPTVYGPTAEETAQGAKALIVAMKNEGLIDLVSKAADYVRSTHKQGGQAVMGAPVAPPTFQNGQVVQQQAAPSPAPAAGGYTCAHGNRNFKDGGTWQAYFCGAPQGTDKSQQCAPLWKDKKTGQFK